MGILKLAQEKKVDLSTDINTYLKSWKFPYDSLSKGKKITLAQLLSHQAGLTVHGFPGHDINGTCPNYIYEVLDGKKPSFTPAVRSAFEPDLKFQYSGGGTSISQVLLSNVFAGKPYDVWDVQNVLKPIGIVNSDFSAATVQAQTAPVRVGLRGDGTPIERKFHVYPEQAAAGLWMTPTDLCHYIVDMQLAWKGGKSKVLNPEMVKLHLTPYHNGPTAMGTFIDDLDGEFSFSTGQATTVFADNFLVV